MKQLVLFILFFSISLQLSADSNRFRIFKENSDKRVVITNNKPTSMFYEKATWNQNSFSIDAGYLYLRDKNTGKLTELTLTETQPDSAVFSLEVPIGGLKSNKISAELFSAPQSMLQGKDRMKVMQKLVSEKNVKRKPFILRVLKNKGQVIDVFDDKATAIAAYNKYKTQLGLDNVESESVIQVKNQEKIEKKKIIDTSTLQSLFMANENDLKSGNEKNKELRDVLMEVEKKRRQKIKNDGNNWSSSKRASNKTKGKDLIKKAISQMSSKDHKSAMDNFYDASNLVPSSEDIYGQYGVGLFNADKYNQSIVVLTLAQTSSNRVAEKHFYLGMNYYKLKDYENAVIHFNKVMEMKDKTFGPTAAFYKGSALVELKKFDESKESFQYVLDNSNDPKMDSKAEKYIESAIELKTLEEKRSNSHFFDGVIGLMYDSNIILATNAALNDNNLQGEGWRFLLQGGYKYRPYYTESDELSVKLDVLAMRSTNESFGSNSDAEKADPYVFTVGVPWTHRGTLGGKGYFFDLTPGYETILMDLDGTSTKAIVNSIKLDFDNTLVVNKNWIAKGDYSFSSNDSSILGDETGADSFGASLTLSSIFILNKDRERYLIPEFSYSLNDAKGSAFSYTRLDLAVSFTTAIFDTFLWNSRAGYFVSNFKNNRTDNNYSISSGLSYHISPHWDWGLTGSYTVNNSNTNSFDKYSFLSAFSFSY